MEKRGNIRSRAKPLWVNLGLRYYPEGCNGFPMFYEGIAAP